MSQDNFEILANLRQTNNPPEELGTHKKCPFCFEEILADAIKCKHCGEFLDTTFKRELQRGKTQYSRVFPLWNIFCLIITLALGVSWSIIIGVIVGLIELKTGFAFYSLMLLFVIPIGSILTGFIASGGYYLGSKVLHQKPAGGILINLVIIPVTTFLVIHYIQYFMLEIDSVRIKDFVTFWQYLDWDIKHTSISFRRIHSAPLELGSFWGYVFVLLQLIGFSFGGLPAFARSLAKSG
jgi:hypothetical protein